MNKIESYVFHNIDATIISNDRYMVTILNGRGCNVIDMYDIGYNRHILHTPTTAELEEFCHSPQRFGSAILFPPNRIRNGAFTRNQITYDFEGNGYPLSHGLLKEVSYTMVDSFVSEEKITCSFVFDSKEHAIYKKLDWVFTCLFTFELTDKGLSHKITITNNGSFPIPCGVGYHTSFMIPKADASDYRIKVGCNRRWETDSHLIPTGNQIPLPLDFNEQGVAPLSMPLAIHTDAAALPDGVFGAKIIDLRNNYTVVYKTDTIFSNWMIWNNNASDDYVCIEPMSWIIDAPNASIEDSLSGYRELRTNQSFIACNHIYTE